MDFLQPILFRLENIFNVLSAEIQSINSDNIVNLALNGAIIFFPFYFVSKWFRAYIIRLILFLFGAFVLWNVSARDHILNSFDFYGALGMIIPQLEIVEITYLIIRDRTIFIYNQFVGLLLLILSPFIWLYEKFLNIFDFIKVKQNSFKEQREYKKQEQEEFKKAQEQEYQREQAQRDKKYRQQQEEQKSKQQKQKQKKQNKTNTHKKDEQNKNSRWESNDPYIILGINQTATKAEIKKAYRKLAKIYHPDLSLTNKEKAEEIFKKINWAYESLK